MPRLLGVEITQAIAERFKLDGVKVLLGQRILPRIANLCAGLCIAIWFVTVMVCAIMPSTTGKGYASSKFVWGEWNNQTGWSNAEYDQLIGEASRTGDQAARYAAFQKAEAALLENAPILPRRQDHGWRHP